MNFGTSYHPQTDGQTKHKNHIIEYMLQIYVRTKPPKWEEYLHFVEFAYNNNYQASTKMIPFKVLYGNNCTTTISWDNLVELIMVGPEILQETEQMVKKVQQNLKVLQDQ